MGDGELRPGFDLEVPSEMPPTNPALNIGISKSFQDLLPAQPSEPVKPYRWQDNRDKEPTDEERKHIDDQLTRDKEVMTNAIPKDLLQHGLDGAGRFAEDFYWNKPNDL